MRKISIFFAMMLIASFAIGQNLTQQQTLPNYQQLSILKATAIAPIDFEQLANDLESTATRTPDGQIRCFSKEYNDMLRLKYPQLGSEADFESWIAPKIQEYNDNVANGLATQKVVVTIPVIMHIIHNSTEGVGTGRNISQAQATSQITILNNDFRKLNSDTSLIPTVFKPLAADLEINFVPALRYASNHALAGNTLAEPGIDRISAPTISGVANTTTGYSTTFIDATIKPNTYWNRTEVMNIWVCQISGGILGYAQFPTGSGLLGLTGGATGANTDGLVLLYTATGTGGVAAAPYNKGRTATHEIGHWFGLRHIWGDESACAADDYVTDTPQQKGENYGCPTYPQTTGTGGRCSTGDPSSMYMNYMDYTDDACMFMFTEGQKARVVTVLANSPGRVELPTSTLGSPLATTAQFSGTPLSIPVGNSVTFTDQSISPNTITTWNWTFTGGTPSSFVGQTPPAITYSAAGNYAVSLTVTDNLLGTDNETKTAYINVFTAPTCDTLNYPPAGTIVAYTTGSGLGYVMGNNQYGDLAKAEYISSTAHAPYTYVTGGRFAVRSARDGGNGATVSFNVWDATGTGGSPGTVLGTVTVLLSALNTNTTGYENTIMQIMYPTAVNVGTAPYYFGFKMNGFGTGDTLGIFSNTSGDSSPGTAWEQQSDNIWYDVDAAWGGLPITSYLSPIMSQNAPGSVLTTNTTTICAGGSVNYNATTSTNTLSYSWVFNGGTPGTSTTGTQTVTYAAAGSPKTYLTLTGNCGAASKDSVTITVNANVTPTFTAVTPKCSGSTIAALPTTSNNAITGTWSPAINNTATTTYTFTPTAGQCATTTTMSITITPNVTPTFTAVTPKCSGATIAALPTTSNNGIAGTWSPAINNTATTTYTFTPTAGQCATTTTMSITITPNVTPTFTAVTPKCSGSTIAALPTTSNNGITGTWSPAINNTATTTYTFTPTAGQCATTTTMVITITPATVPTFTQVAAICSGGSLSALPTTSNNAITGTWSPAINNTATTTYTFTPTTGQCATSTTMTITVNSSSVTPTFTAVTPQCSGATIAALPTTSNNAITGTWSPAINNTATTTYTFTPTAGQCASTTTMSITITPNVTPTFTAVTPKCSGATIAALPTTSNNAITGTWSPAINNTATTTYTFTPTAGQCASTTTMSITITPNVTPTFTAVTPKCSGATIAALPTTSNNAITGTWSPAINNTATTTYTFTPTAGQCATTTTMVISIVGVINTQESVMVCNFGSYTFPDGTTQTNITSQVVYNSTLISSGGCDSIVETTVNVQVCTGIEVIESNEIKIFPNPVNKLLTIQAPNSNVSQIRMINILGEVIVNMNTINSNTNTINVERFPLGIYFIQLSDNEGKVVITEKVVVN